MVAAIETTKLLVAAKTYPSLSSHYNEVVCTAGIRADGRWVRLYPVQYRALPKLQRFRKYQWIEASLCRDPKDPRPESHKLDGVIQPLQWLSTQNNWAKRKEVLLQNVYYDLSTVISVARDIRSFQSLFVFKPTTMLQFKVHRCDNFDYLDRKRETIIHRLPDKADLVDCTPYTFFYSFSDIKGKTSTLRIIDWEIYQLTRKLRSKYGDSEQVIEILRWKYWNELALQKDLYFFLGSNRYWHIRRSSNPFMIIGVFYPPKASVDVSTH